MDGEVFSLRNESDVEEILQMLQNDDDLESSGASEEETDTEEDVHEEDNERIESDNNDSLDTDEDNNDVDSNDEHFYYAYQKRNNRIIETWKWKKTPYNEARRRAPQNIIIHLPGVKGPGKNVSSAEGAWNLLIDDHILCTIVECTNKYILKIRNQFTRCRDAKITDLVEIKAFIGLSYLAGVYKANHLNLEELWSTNGDGIEIFRLTMGLRRFRFLIRCLRFDDLETRQDRRKIDRLAPIRECFQRFNENCQKCYSPGENITLDEMLIAFRGKCVFRQYNPKKPARYGIKIFSLVDSRIFYTYNMEIYAGTQPEGPFSLSNQSVEVVKRLVRPVSGSGRNVTLDNWFCNYSLLNDLREIKLSLVGTLRSNKPQIPSVFKCKRREANSSMFGFQKNGTLVSYVPNIKKNVFLLSSTHFNDEIDQETGDLRKPAIVTYYNKTKGGVDTVDRMIAAYNVSRATKRWPMVIFYTMLNIAGINSQILFTGNRHKVKSRRVFLRQLGVSLLQEQLQRRRTNNTGLPLPISIGIKRLQSEISTPQTAELPDDSGKRLPCSSCQQTKRRRLTKYKCHVCKLPLCLEHSRMRCQINCKIISANDCSSTDED